MSYNANIDNAQSRGIEGTTTLCSVVMLLSVLPLLYLLLGSDSTSKLSTFHKVNIHHPMMAVLSTVFNMSLNQDVIIPPVNLERSKCVYLHSQGQTAPVCANVTREVMEKLIVTAVFYFFFCTFVIFSNWLSYNDVSQYFYIPQSFIRRQTLHCVHGEMSSPWK